MVNEWDESYDFVIVGSGAGMSAALVAKTMGKRALIIEKTDKVGGSTALSGGVMWVPNNPVSLRAGVPDSMEQARAYLDACIGDSAPKYSGPRKEAYLVEGPKAIAFFESLGMKFVHAEGYSCYHENEKPGGMARSRSIEAEIFDLNELGEWEPHLRRRPVFIPVHMHEVHYVGIMGRTLASKYHTAKVGLRLLRNKMGAKLAGMGLALQGRMLQLVLKHNIDIWRESPVTDFVVNEGRVVGVAVQRNGKPIRVQARSGVLVDAGGFSRNLDMRQKFGPQPASVDWTNSNPGDTGEMIGRMVELGAALGNMDQAVWTPVSLMPDGNRGIHPGDMSKPYCIMVNEKGERFVNESTSYMSLGQAMYRQKVPAWYVMDNRFRRYRWAGYPAGEPPAAWLASGYMKKGNTVEELAKQCGIDSAALRSTVDRFNEFARTGDDQDFNRGKSAYNRFWGDVTVKPNPNLGSIEQGPFYAVQAFPGDVGTFGGALVDEFSRVLKDDGTPIPGLYATGNATASFTGASYPGAGASIGPAYVFGYVAARHALSA